MAPKYKDKDAGVVLAFNGQWISWSHTVIAYCKWPLSASARYSIVRNREAADLQRSGLSQRPDRGMLAALPQDRPEPVVRISRRVVPLGIRCHRRSVSRTVLFYALHRHHVWYARPPPAQTGCQDTKYPPIRSEICPRWSMVSPDSQTRPRPPESDCHHGTTPYTNMRRVELHHLDRRP